LYHAKLHPEQYSDTFSHAQLKQLHKSIQHVCQTAVDVLADSSKFPDEWLFNHRWGKGKKDAPTTLPNGAKITFLTVGGRTSCVVPSVQKKTGAVAGDVKSNGAEKEEAVEEDSRKGSKQTKRKAAPEKVAVEISKPLNGKGQKKPDAISSAEVKEEDMDGAKPTAKKRKADATSTEVLTKSAQKESINTEATAAGRRRSGRVSNKTG
jgi:formamidopyrimidine-DNA glycosylase